MLFSRTHFSTRPPSNVPLLLRTTTTTRGAYYVADEPSLYSDPTPTREYHSPREQLIAFLKEEPDSQWTSETITISDTVEDLIRDFQDGLTVSVSDGSFFAEHNVGAMEWKIENRAGNEFIRAGGIILGLHHSAYRSELGGLYGLTLGLYALWRVQPTTHPILVACDGLSALQRSLVFSEGRQSTSCEHYDLISSIMRYWSLMKNLQYPVHVRGHQDAHGLPLSRLERINVEVDRFAQARAVRHIHQRGTTRDGYFPKGFPKVTVHGKPVASRLYHT